MQATCREFMEGLAAMAVAAGITGQAQGGQRYEVEVPDTLDLAERAELALHGIASTIDPEDEYNIWFEVFWCKNPPYMLHYVVLP